MTRMIGKFLMVIVALAIARPGIAARVWVGLETEPLAAAQAPGRRAAPAALSRQRAQVAAEQDRASLAVEQLGGRILGRYELLSNALFVEIPDAEVATLATRPGIRTVQPERHYRRSTGTSVPFVHAPRAWSPAGGGFTGQGVSIGIIDSGIDYTHADFGGAGTTTAYLANNPTRVEASTFPTARVRGGTDFCGDDYDSTGEKGSTSVRPDPDPLDPMANGHGTHVAGIAAGQGVLKSGRPYTGPYTNQLSATDFEVGPGVAPQVNLYALKVFGRDGSTSASLVVRALEWASDPNGDGDTRDHLDVVNLSLGSPFGTGLPGDIESDAINALALVGVVSVVAAGNSGNTAYIVGSPGDAARGITVANSYDDGFALSLLRVIAPGAVAGPVGMIEGSFTPKLKLVGPVTAQVVAAVPSDGCEPLRNTAQLNGKLAMIDRGVCFFSDKVRAAQAAGAVGVIFVNHVDGPPIAMGASGDTSDISIPAVMISQADGAQLRPQISAGLTITLEAGAELSKPELADQLNEGSARGPLLGTGALKPDLAAPGSSIISAAAGSGFESASETGTSMSTPHVAGAAALVRQSHPLWSTEDLKAALMNTAAVSMRAANGASYPESRVGAGRLDVGAAVATRVVARNAGVSGEVSLSFPPQTLTGPVSLPARVRLVNHGPLAATYSISSRNTLDQPGAQLVPGQTNVTVAAGSSALIDVRLELDPNRLVPDADRSSGPNVRGGGPRFGIPEACGQLWFTGGPAGSERLHLPWYAVVRAASDLSLSATAAGLSSGSQPEIRIAMRGRSVVPRPVLGCFEFGAETRTRAGAFLAVGAASDAAVTGGGPQTRLFFGVALEPTWETLQRLRTSFEVELDLDSDGVADRILLNANSGSLAGTGPEDLDSANDGFVTAVRGVPGQTTVTGEIWNALSPAIRDTAPFPGGRAVLSAQVGVLSLPAGPSTLRYRARFLDSTVVSDPVTEWQTFDYLQPLVDATPFGLEHTPWLDATNARVRIQRAAANGRTSAQVMVFPQNNSGGGYQKLNLSLTSNDVNQNGLPDDWELDSLGDLDSTGLAAADRDGDGFSDAAEFRAGTNPLDSNSRLALLVPRGAGNAVRWSSSPGRTYTILRSDRLGNEFRPVGRNLPATPPVNEFVDPDPIVGDAVFYRVRLE